MFSHTRLMLLALAAGTALLAACGGSDAPDSAGTALADRWLRLGEEPRAEVLIFDRALPPGFSALLNPDATTDTPAEDLVALPVHPEGVLLGSSLIRRTDGANLIWVMVDVPGRTIEETLATVSQQLDETPWQVTGGQGQEAYSLLSFQSTRSGDIQGTAVVQPVPASATFELTVEREGSRSTLTVARGAIYPLLDADVADDLRILSTRPGLVAAAGLRQDDRIVALGATNVATRAELDAALSALASVPGAVASISYLMQIAPPLLVPPPAFAAPTGLGLPDSFPAREALDGLLVLEYSWAREPAGVFYQASLISRDATSDVADRLRAGLEAGGWTILDDSPFGFATQMVFEHEVDGVGGVASVDLFDVDEDYTEVLIRIQTDPTAGN
ncbi:MAG: hypothetical protein O2798_09685 [Chloroflexi bacterium]|nr:hypothetical protein [Chloroflexota bacterium]MDA1241099.1 hypothetical protein [Chloroflexota bacterium]